MAGFLSALLGVGASPRAPAAASSPGGRGGGTARSLSFTLPQLQELYGRLSHFRESDLEKDRGGEQVVDLVREITEALVWGEKHDSSLFDFFCEKGILVDFIRVLSLQRAPKTVKVQILQTLSMLVQNIRREQSLFYLLSNNQVNKLILMPLDFNDEEILAYWITLLKSLAMRLDDTTISFFFISLPEPVFPLYCEAIKFFNHRDQMVRATVRTITLRVYRVDFAPMRAFVQRHAEESYFSQLALHLKAIWLRMNAAAADSEDHGALQHENDLQQDLLVYLSDMFELGIEELNRALADRLLDCAMVPLLVLSLDPRSAADRSKRQVRLAPAVALFLLRQVLELIRNPALVQPLVAAILQPSVPEPLRCIMPHEAPTEFRSHFLRFLRGRDDAGFMYSAGIVHCCVRSRQALPAEFLQAAGIFPPPPRGRRPDPGLVSEAQMDVLFALLTALRRHAEWRSETFSVLVQVVLDVFVEPAVAGRAECHDAALRAARDALTSAGDALRQLIEAEPGGGEGSDALLDAFAEAEGWDARGAPPPPPRHRSVSELCSDSWRLLLEAAPARGAAQPAALSPPPLGAAERAQRAVSSFAQLRRLLAALRSGRAADDAPPAAPAGGPRTPVPDLGALRSVREGAELVAAGDAERLPCSVMAPEGARPRCLVLTRDALLVARPDAGRTVVTTFWPVHQVQSLIDRGDPRVLRLALQPSPDGRRPGEALEYNPPAPVGRRRPFFTLALVFEDVRRCHAADVHLQRCRREVRAALLRRVLGVVKECQDQAATGPRHEAGL